MYTYIPHPAWIGYTQMTTVIMALVFGLTGSEVNAAIAAVGAAIVGIIGAFGLLVSRLSKSSSLAFDLGETPDRKRLYEMEKKVNSICNDVTALKTTLDLLLKRIDSWEGRLEGIHAISKEK